MHRESSAGLLPSIEIPVLIINDEEDIPRPPAWSDEIYRRVFFFSHQYAEFHVRGLEHH